jgi:hypothetical protein
VFLRGSSCAKEQAVFIIVARHTITAQIKYLGIWMIHIVEEIELLLLLGNRLFFMSRLTTVGQAYPDKHIRNNARCLVTKSVKWFSVGYF